MNEFFLYLNNKSNVFICHRKNVKCIFNTQNSRMSFVICLILFVPKLFFFFFLFYFIFKLYITVLVLPNIKMNPPQVYMCSPSWTLLPPPSPFHPSRSSQCTSPKHPVSCIEPGLATHFIHDILHVSMPFSQIFPPSPSKYIFMQRTSLVAQTVKHLPTMWETWVQSLGREDFLEKEMATHSSILAWKIPWTEEPGRLQSMGSQRVGHNWATPLSLLTVNPHLRVCFRVPRPKTGRPSFS